MEDYSLDVPYYGTSYEDEYLRGMLDNEGNAIYRLVKNDYLDKIEQRVEARYQRMSIWKFIKLKNGGE